MEYRGLWGVGKESNLPDRWKSLEMKLRTQGQLRRIDWMAGFW